MRPARQPAALAGAREVGLALAPGRDFAVALHACLLAGVRRVPVDLRLGRGRACPRRRAAATSCSRRCPPAAPAQPSAARPRSRRRSSSTPRAPAATPKRVELTYGNWLWSALGAARRDGPRRRTSAGCARCRSSHVGGLSILLRSAIYATTAIVHERFDAERGARGARAATSTVVSLVPTTLVAAARRRARAPACAALRADRRGSDPARPARARAGRRACRSRRPTA